MIALITSWAPIFALRKPGIEAHSAPPTMPASSASGR
jgi:hypothetical protein